MKRYKMFFIIGLFILIISISLIGAYAYYSGTHETQDVSGNAAVENENITGISSFEDLFNYGTNSIYNDKNSKALSNKRYILKLNSNIKLENNLIIDNDVHIDLNDKTINLNDYTLTIKNGYNGCFAIYNGIIESGEKEEGSIIVDMPNMGFIADEIEYTKNNIESDSLINEINIDQKYATYNALYLVGNALSSDFVLKPEIKSYNEVSKNDFILSADKFILSKDCYKNTNEACSIVYKDLMLPTYYLSSDISITYSFKTLNNYLKTNGKFTAPATSADVTLTATVSKEGWNNAISVDFLLHLVNLNDNTTLNNCVKNLINSELSPYYNEGDLVVKEATILEDYYYGIHHGITMPLSAFDGKVTFEYSTTNLADSSINTSSYISNGFYNFIPNQSCYHLIITPKINSVAQTPIKVQMYSTYVGEKETIAYLIVNELYGGTIIYDRSKENKILDDLEAISDNDELSGYINDYDITNITYSIVTDSDAFDYYQINNYVMTVKNGEIPDDKVGYIRVTLTFGESTNISIDLYINYLDESGDTLSNFITYYNLIDPTIETELETSFELPFHKNSEWPYVCYDIGTYQTSLLNETTIYNVTLGMPKNVKLNLFYDNTDHFLTYDNNPSTFTAKYATTLNAAANYNDAKFILSISAQDSLTVNTNLVLVYNYKFKLADEWKIYKYNDQYLTDLTVSKFTALGGLFYNTTGQNESGEAVNHAVKDAYFFRWIYNNFKPSTKASINTARADLIIPINWLGQDYSINVSTDTLINSVNDFTGIGYLSGVSSVDLSGKTITSTIVTSISNMQSLNTLILKGCGITDVSDFSNLKNVKVLDVSGNSIQYFDSLAEITSLEKVYLYNNNASNAYYGSLGICNFQAYNDLMRNGCAVYNSVSNNVPVLFADSNNLDDYRRLKAIVYQDKLKKGLDISQLYNKFSTNRTDYGLSTNGTLVWSYGGGTNATDATYFMVTYTFNTYKLVCKYYVDRY